MHSHTNFKALTALHKVLKTLTIAEEVKKIARYLYNHDVHGLLHNIPPLVPIPSQINPFCKCPCMKINVHYCFMF